MPVILKKAFAAISLLLFIGCVEIADYSLQAYTNATSLKARSLSLVAKATEPYATHRAEAEALLIAIDEAYEFANGIENNNEAARMWEILRDPDRTLVGGFVNAWETGAANGFSTDESGGSPFLREVGQNLSDSFDRLICLEANKREPSACPAPAPNL
ncbi:MAG: hypothetical protein AAFU41_14670 [Pseudomonadota bacterium]